MHLCKLLSKCKLSFVIHIVFETIYFVFLGLVNDFFSIFFIHPPPPPHSPTRKIMVRPLEFYYVCIKKFNHSTHPV